MSDRPRKRKLGGAGVQLKRRGMRLAGVYPIRSQSPRRGPRSPCPSHSLGLGIGPRDCAFFSFLCFFISFLFPGAVFPAARVLYPLEVLADTQKQGQQFTLLYSSVTLAIETVGPHR